MGTETSPVRTDNFAYELLGRQSTFDPDKGWRRLGRLRAFRCFGCSALVNITSWLHVSEEEGQSRVDLDGMVPTVLDG